MPRPAVSLALAALLLWTAGCTTAPTTATRLEPGIRAKVEKGLIEPGFTPEMVFLALGKPSEPASSLADATTNGTWAYHDFRPKTERGLPRPGQRLRIAAGGNGKDKVVSEPLDPKSAPELRGNSLFVTFRDGRVVEIQRTGGAAVATQ